MIYLFSESISSWFYVAAFDTESCILISDFSLMRLAFDARSSLFSLSLTFKFSMSSLTRSESCLICVLYAVRSAS